MSEQPNALRLAGILERPGYGWHSTPVSVAYELRRLHELNAELLAALRHLEHNARASGAEMGLALDVARATIAKATGNPAPEDKP